MSDTEHDDNEDAIFRQYAGQAMQALITASWTNPGPAQTACKEFCEALPPDRKASFNDWVAFQAHQYAVAMVRHWREVTDTKDDKGSGPS